MSDNPRVTSFEPAINPTKLTEASNLETFKQFDEVGASQYGKLASSSHGLAAAESVRSAPISQSAPKSGIDISRESAVLQEMFRKLACSLCETLVSHTSELRIEATVGVTVDGGARIVLVHFADRVSRNDDVSAAAADTVTSAGEPRQVCNNRTDANNSASLKRLSTSHDLPTVAEPSLTLVSSPATMTSCTNNNVDYDIDDRFRECSGSWTDGQVEPVAKVEIVNFEDVFSERQRDEQANHRQESEQTLRQLFNMPPVLKWPTDRGSVPSSGNAVAHTMKIGEVVPSKPSGRSTILGKLLTSKDSDSYLSMCHPQAVAAYPQFASRPVQDVVTMENVSGCFSNIAADDVSRTKRIAVKRARNPDDDDEEWKPKTGCRNRYQRLQEQGSAASMLRSKSDQQTTMPSLTARPTSSYQFSNLLHHLVERNLSANCPSRVGSSDSRGPPASVDGSSFLIAKTASLQQNDKSLDERSDYMLMNVKQEIDDASYGSSSCTYTERTT